MMEIGVNLGINQDFTDIELVVSLTMVAEW